MVKLEAECALSTFQGERNGLQDLWDVGPSLRAWWANVSRAGAWLSWLTCRLWLSPGASPYLLILQSPSFFRLSAVVFWGTNSGAAGGANRQGNGAKAMGKLEVRVHPGRLGQLAVGNGSWGQPWRRFCTPWPPLEA